MRAKEYTEDEMLAATRNYAAWCRREGVESRFIKQAATFFGPGGHMEEFKSGIPPSRRSGVYLEDDSDTLKKIREKLVDGESSDERKSFAV